MTTLSTVLYKVTREEPYLSRSSESKPPVEAVLAVNDVQDFGVLEAQLAVRVVLRGCVLRVILVLRLRLDPEMKSQ